MKIRYLIIQRLFLPVTLLFAVSPINAATINFSGEIGFVEYDSGSSIYSGVSLGDLFTGSFTYGDSVSDASSVTSVAPTATHYSFTGSPYGGSITNETVTAVGVDSIVGVGDNDGIGDDTYLLNNLYGITIPYDTISDPWGVSSSNNTQAFGIELYSLDTSLFSSTDLPTSPPELGDFHLSFFYIEELDELGNSIYLATGKLSSITAVPESASFWLLGAGLICLLGISLKRKNNYNSA
jgi:hypothetical protein